MKNHQNHLSLRLGLLACNLGLCLGLVSALAAEEAPLKNLMLIPSAGLVRVSDPWLALDQCQLVFDGNTVSACSLRPRPQLPVDLVMGFGGEIVTLEQLAIQWEAVGNESQTPSASRPRLEVLASTLSPRIGFQLLRQEALAPAAGPQSWMMPQTAAKWIMLRFTSADQAASIRISEIQLLGHPGQPQSRYAFKTSPASALAVVKQLSKTSGDFSVSPEEKSLFTDAQDGKLDQWSWAEAMLLASRVKGSHRAKYLAQLADLEKTAAGITSGEGSAFNRAEKLLQWLHEGPMSYGYRPSQTDLSVLLELKTFNCLSSVCLYNLLGRRLGLDLRAIEVPDHAFSIIYDGLNHADIETTTPLGFNLAGNPDAIRQVQTMTGFGYVPDDRQELRRELGEVGLLALIYYNHGVLFTQQRNYPEALRAYFCSLSLDRECASAVHNVLAVLGNWGQELAQAKKYADALKVIDSGLVLVPQDPALKYNQKAIWSQWALAALESGDTNLATRVFQQAARSVPEGNFGVLQAWIYIKPGLNYVEKGEWGKALLLAELGRKKIEARGQRELDTWIMGLYSDWANAELEKKHYPEAGRILEAAMAAMPGEKNFSNNFAFVVLAWAKDLWQTQGPEAAERMLFSQAQAHPRLTDLRRAFMEFVNTVAEAASQSPQAADRALATLHHCWPLIQSDHEALNLMRSTLDRAAGKYLQEQNWLQAVEVYQQGLKDHPQDTHLRNNARAAWDLWIEKQIQKNDWEAALQIADQAWHATSRDAYFADKLGFIVQEYSERLYKNEGERQAEAYLTRVVKTHPEPDAIKLAAGGYVNRRLEELKNDPFYEPKAAKLLERCQGFVMARNPQPAQDEAGVDAQAAELIQNKDYAQAVRVYQDAIAAHPKNLHLQSNAEAVWDMWIQSTLEQKDFEQGMRLCEQAVAQNLHPDHFKQKLGYLVQEAATAFGLPGDLEPAEKYFTGVLQRAAGNRWVKEAVGNFFGRSIQEMALEEAGAFEASGWRLIASCQRLLAEPRPRPNFIHLLYDRLADQAIQTANWPLATQVYDRALKKCPGDQHLKNNAVAAWDAWAHTYIQAQDWQQAAAVYTEGLKAFPKDPLLANNLGYCRAKLKK